MKGHSVYSVEDVGGWCSRPRDASYGCNIPTRFRSITLYDLVMRVVEMSDWTDPFEKQEDYPDRRHTLPWEFLE